MKAVLVFVAAVLCGGSMPAFAGSHDVNKQPLVARTLESFNQNVDRIHEQMKAGGVYEHISPSERGRVDQRIEQMRALLTAHSTENDMTASDKVALLNAQEEVNGILSHNDNNRLVCEHSAPTGSHILRTRCRTYGEMMARREKDRKSLEDRARMMQMKGGASVGSP